MELSMDDFSGICPCEGVATLVESPGEGDWRKDQVDPATFYPPAR